MINKYYWLAKNKLFYLNRSLTGKGTLQTLHEIKKKFKKLKIKNFSSGKKVFDWKIPNEWNVSEAYVLDKYNHKIIDFKQNNLHLINYSSAVRKIIKKNLLLKKLHFLKNQPNAIPYITSYYKKYWGFCVSFNQYKKIKKTYYPKDKFKIIINSKFNKKGKLNYGELIIKGKSKKEILISTYICHPSMANNELSGPIVSMALIEYFNKKKLNYTLRFVFIPETIGSISYIKKNFHNLKLKVIGGFNLSCIGDERQHSCMLSKYGNSPSDESIVEAYKYLKIKKYKIYSFLKRGSDERQYNSPGVDLKISSIFRTKYGEYPEYHTSLDNFNIVTLKGLKGGFEVAKKSIEILNNKIFPKFIHVCEPHMSKRNLYPTLSKKNHINKNIQNCMNFLQYADGNNSLEKISNYIGINLRSVKKINNLLLKKKLIKI